MQKQSRIQSGLLIAFLAETICVSYALKFPAYIDAASVIYFISGIAIALLFVCLPETAFSFSVFSKAVRISVWYKLLLVVIMGVVMHHFTRNRIMGTPLSINSADMLPIMKVMSQRFLQGQWMNVYSPIPEIWGGVQPVYLPAMWLPFTLSVAGNFDMRWITMGGLFFSFSVFLLLFDPFKKQILLILLPFSAFILFWWLQTEEMHNFIRLSEEGIVVFYYSLLVLSLLSGNYLLIGIAAALCTLSRFSLAGWLPAMLVYLLFIRKNKKQLGAFVITGLITGLLLVILPFGWKVIPLFMQLPSRYIEHADSVWKNNPEYFYHSMGFAKFFGPHQTELLHRVLLSVSFAVPLLFMAGCFCWQQRNKKMLPNVPLACLKLSIVVFYTFLDVPYLYLFYTSSFVSLIAITYFLTKHTYNNP